VDLAAFEAEVGVEGPVTIAGRSTRGGAVPAVRQVTAPSGIDWIQADEMTMACGAGTSIDDVTAALAEVGQRVALPPGGTVGGALSAGQSGIRRLGDGFVRDVLLQAHYVSAAGEVVKAGGPTVKNVSGFDVCRLLVGARGTLGFLGDVILRTRPVPASSQWFVRDCPDPYPLFSRLHRPVSVLWDGERAWALLEGHPRDVEEQSRAAGLDACDGPPDLPTGSRRFVDPSTLAQLRGTFVAEVGTGVVHHADSWTPSRPESSISVRLKQLFDPTGRLNPGVVV
jgi:glycolate oxidase FAD binding subunit